jgi:tape measure domain-containing protein
VYDLATVQNTTAQLAANGVKDYDKLTEAAGNLNAVAGGNQDTFGSVAMMLTQTAGAGKLTTENWNQLADAIPGASGVMQDALEKNGAYTGNFRDAMEKGEISADEFNTALMELGTDPVAVEAAKSTETMEGAVAGLSATIVSGLAGAINFVKPVLTGLITTFAGFIANSQVFIPVIAGLGTVLLIALAPAIWAAVVATWAFTAALLANPVTWIAIAIGLLIAAIVALAMNWDAVVAWVTGVWITFLAWFTGVMDGFIGWWNGIWAAVWLGLSLVITSISEGWTALWDGMSSYLKGVWNDILGFIEGGVNGAIDLINGMMDGIRDAAGFIGIEVGTIPHVSIPRLAEGGIVSKRPGGIPAVIGEGRYDEAVVPLSPGVLSQLGGGSGGTIQQTNNFAYLPPEVAVEMAGQRLTSVAKRARA